MKTSDESGFITAHGHYQELLSYQKAEVIYDVTFRFCGRFLKRGDRTIDQITCLIDRFAGRSKILSKRVDCARP